MFEIFQWVLAEIDVKVYRKSVYRVMVNCHCETRVTLAGRPTSEMKIQVFHFGEIKHSDNIFLADMLSGNAGRRNRALRSHWNALAKVHAFCMF